MLKKGLGKTADASHEAQVFLLFQSISVDRVSNLRCCFSEGSEAGIQSESGALPKCIGTPVIFYNTAALHSKCHFY